MQFYGRTMGGHSTLWLCLFALTTSGRTLISRPIWIYLKNTGEELLIFSVIRDQQRQKWARFMRWWVAFRWWNLKYISFFLLPSFLGTEIVVITQTIPSWKVSLAYPSWATQWLYMVWWFHWPRQHYISNAECKTAVTLLLTYCSLH